MTAKHKGYVLWRGLSPINGQPIVAVLTITSANRKTGNMMQVWILNESCDPVQSIATGEDVSICGNCPHRKQPDGTRTCYVNPGQAPLSVYRTWQSGGYHHINTLSPDGKAKLFKGRGIRWGAYGDPACIPADIVAECSALASYHTAYTHQWGQPWAAAHRRLLMASCDSVTDHDKAKAMGWATFTVASVNARVIHAKQCPATVEHSQAQCASCKLCNGAKSDIYVHAHGPSRKAVTYV